MFFFIFFDISSLLLRYITPAIPRSSRLDLSKNILKNIDSYLNFRTLVLKNAAAGTIGVWGGVREKYRENGFIRASRLWMYPMAFWVMVGITLSNCHPSVIIPLLPNAE